MDLLAVQAAGALAEQAADIRATSRELRARARRARALRIGLGVAGGSGSEDQRTLIAHVRSALALKTLPLATKYTSTGDGTDVPCTVCELRVEPKDTECRIGSWGHAHLVCYLIWVVESRRLIYGEQGRG